MKRRSLLAGLVGLLALVGCSNTQATPEKTEPVTIFAAASLHSVLPELLAELAPDTPVTFNFDGSSGLVDQLSAGAHADLLLTANQKNMDKAIAKDLVHEADIFATNTLVLVTPAGNPGHITGFNDGSLANKHLVICASEVPCGAATRELAELNNTELSPSSEEQSVTSVLGKVTSGEADAGIVYKTDAQGAEGKVDVIPIENADQVVNKYMIGLTTATGNNEVAQHIRELIISRAGQEKLAEYGFSMIPDRP